MSDVEMQRSDNPLLAESGYPRFDAIGPQHVVPAVRHLLEQAEIQVAELEQSLEPTWDGVIARLEQIDRPFEYGWGPVSHLFGVKNSPELREAYDEVLGDVVAFSLRVRQSRPIYEGLKQIRESLEWSQLSEARRRIIDNRILDAKLAGIGLPDEQRERFNQIAQELSQLSTEFSNHVLDATKQYSLVISDPADAEGLPATLRHVTAQSFNEQRDDQSAPETATPAAGPWRISLDAPVVGPFLQHCRNRELREQVYRAFITRASSGELDNAPLINRILELRAEKAKLLGFDNYGEMSLAQKMAPGVRAVLEMLESLRSASWDSAQQDLEDLRQAAAADGAAESLELWDVAFWSERLREQRFDYTDEDLRPYFPLEAVLDGLFQLCGKLFGIKVVPADGQAPVWHPDVRFFHVCNEQGKQIAAFYLDPYSRPADKRGGAWMDDCLGRRRIGSEIQLPVAHLVCNSTPPVGEKPSLMSFREVETLFHEFGHGLQHMLTVVDDADAAGISGVEWDAVELPSQFMENWCYHKVTLVGLSRHYETGEPLPDDLFEKILAARTFQSGMQMLRQLRFGLTDLELHTNYDPQSGETVLDVQKRISQTTSVLPPLEEDRTLCSFQHIFAGGYAAGYYSYKWAEVLSADAFGAFEEAGLDNEQAVIETGRRFRDTVLASGGGRHPMDVFRDFRGREPSIDALLRHSGLQPTAG